MRKTIHPGTSKFWLKISAMSPSSYIYENCACRQTVIESKYINRQTTNNKDHHALMIYQFINLILNGIVDLHFHKFRILSLFCVCMHFHSTLLRCSTVYTCLLAVLMFNFPSHDACSTVYRHSTVIASDSSATATTILQSCSRMKAIKLYKFAIKFSHKCSHRHTHTRYNAWKCIRWSWWYSGAVGYSNNDTLKIALKHISRSTNNACWTNPIWCYLQHIHSFVRSFSVQLKSILGASMQCNAWPVCCKKQKGVKSYRSSDKLVKLNMKSNE